MEMKMVLDDRSRPAGIDSSLIRLLVRADGIRARLMADPGVTLSDIAAEQGVTRSYTTRLVRLAFLAPDIVGDILAGQQPPELTARRLMDNTRLPLDWTAQRDALGFD